MSDETDYKWLAEMYEKTMKAYQSENARLRELCADIWRHAMQMGEFAEQYAFASEFNARMRELGVVISDG